jgi:hypothetical protein
MDFSRDDISAASPVLGAFAVSAAFIPSLAPGWFPSLLWGAGGVDSPAERGAGPLSPVIDGNPGAGATGADVPVAAVALAAPEAVGAAMVTGAATGAGAAPGPSAAENRLKTHKNSSTAHVNLFISISNLYEYIVLSLLENNRKGAGVGGQLDVRAYSVLHASCYGAACHVRKPMI